MLGWWRGGWWASAHEEKGVVLSDWIWRRHWKGKSGGVHFVLVCNWDGNWRPGSGGPCNEICQSNVESCVTANGIMSSSSIGSIFYPIWDLLALYIPFGISSLSSTRNLINRRWGFQIWSEESEKSFIHQQEMCSLNSINFCMRIFLVF